MLPLTSDEPLDVGQRDALLARLAGAVADRRMECPAILALEMHRPLSFLGSQMLAVLTPMLAPAVGLQNMNLAYRLLEDPDNVNRLIDEIEARAAARDGRADSGEVITVLSPGGAARE